MPQLTATPTTADHLRDTMNYLRLYGWAHRKPAPTQTRQEPRDLLSAVTYMSPEVLGCIREAIDPSAEHVSLIEWNDQPDRTYADVKAVLERAIEIAESRS